MGLTVAVKQNKDLGFETDKFILLVVRKLTVKFILENPQGSNSHRNIIEYWFYYSQDVTLNTRKYISPKMFKTFALHPWLLKLKS